MEAKLSNAPLRRTYTSSTNLDSGLKESFADIQLPPQDIIVRPFQASKIILTIIFTIIVTDEIMYLETDVPLAQMGKISFAQDCLLNPQQSRQDFPCISLEIGMVITQLVYQ